VHRARPGTAHLRHLGEHPDIFDVLERRVLAASALGDRSGTADGAVCGHLCLLHDVALLRACRQQQVASGLHGFIDQRVGQLLGLVEHTHGLVGDLIHRVCRSLRELGAKRSIPQG
jgi:hypothetical protein